MEQTDEKKTADYWLNEFHADPLSMKTIQFRDGLAGNLLSRVRWAMEEFSKQEVTLATTAQQFIIDGQKERIEELTSLLKEVYDNFDLTDMEGMTKRINTALNQTKP